MNAVTTNYDIVIVGGGIVGLATAMAVAESGTFSLAVIEAEPKLASHQTGHNSGVIHSGLYYKPGSRKAANCVQGREALYRFCAVHAISHEPCGKIVVATSEDQLPMLEQLYQRGVENGLEGVRKLSVDELAEHEPNVRGLAGLHVPQTGIVDFVQVASTFAELAQNNGADIRKDFRLLSVARDGGGLALETTGGPLHCRYLINCAGLHSDRVARICGCRPKLQIIPFRGEYYQLISEKTSLVRNLIYPVPDPRFPFLGVHFTRMVHGGVEAGPNAVLAAARHGYSKLSFSLRDVCEMLGYRGFWRMAFRYGSTGLGELYRSFSKRAFVRELQNLIPDLRPDDVRPAGAGVRAQAVACDGRLIDDFHIEQDDRMIHVLNAPSPAATASISIGQTIADMARKQFAN